MNTLIKIGVCVFAFVVFSSMVSQCGRRSSITQPSYQSAPPPQVSTQVVLKQLAEGLDLKAVTELAKKSKDAADFESRLNAKDEAVNNIDLNEDGKVDYINVTEYGTGNTRGFSLTTELSPGKVQEIATIEFEKNQDQTTVQAAGNPSLYGPNYYHHSSFGLTDALLVGWLFSNRSSYSSPYGYGHYPQSYGSGWSTQRQDDYARSMRTRTAGSTMTSSSQSVISKSTPSPNAEKIAAKARAISNPTQSQRSFGSSSGSPPTSTSSSRPSGGSGFGSSSPSKPAPSSSSSSSTRSGGFGRSSSSGSSRSGGSFGGGK